MASPIYNVSNSFDKDIKTEYLILGYTEKLLAEAGAGSIQSLPEGTPTPEGEIVWVNSPDGIKQAPKLNALIERALLDANNASLKDFPIPKDPTKPIKIYITNDSEHSHNGSYEGKTRHGEAVIFFSSDWLELPTEVIQANLAHEFSHINQPKANDLLTQKLQELDADRGASNAVANIDDYLRNLVDKAIYSEDYIQFYKVDLQVDSHPPYRDRIAADLARAYGDDVFGKNGGEFKADYKFHPQELNSNFTTENFSTATNWKNEIAPLIEKQIAKDLNKLDKLMANGFSSSERKQFITDIQLSIAEFRIKHPVKLELAAEETMATAFVAAQSIPTAKEVVMAMHPSMPNAFEALSRVIREAEAIENQAARKVVIQQCITNISENIQKGALNNPDVDFCRDYQKNTSLPK